MPDFCICSPLDANTGLRECRLMRTMPILFRGEGAVTFGNVVCSISSATYIVYRGEKCPCGNVILTYFSKFVEFTK